MKRLLGSLVLFLGLLVSPDLAAQLTRSTTYIPEPGQLAAYRYKLLRQHIQRIKSGTDYTRLSRLDPEASKALDITLGMVTYNIDQEKDELWQDNRYQSQQKTIQHVREQLAYWLEKHKSR